MSGNVALSTFPDGAIHRKTPMVGNNVTGNSRVHSWPQNLEEKIMTAPLEMLRLRAVNYLVGKWFGCMKFTASDGSESPKFGDSYQLN